MSGPATRVTRAGWMTLAVVSLTQMMSLLDRNILAILAPRIKADLHIGDAEMGLLYGTVFALFYALFSLPLGRLADGWLRGRLLAICIAVWSIATGLAAAAGGFGTLALSRLGVGIGEAAAQPAGTSMVFDHFPKARRGLAMALMASAIAVGLGVSSMIGGIAADWWDLRFAGAAPLGLSGWQFAFLVAALPGVPLALLLWRLPEPERGAIEGIKSPADPDPFGASWRVLAAILPLTNWLMLARLGARRRQWAINLGTLAAIVLAMTWLAEVTQAVAPRPALQLSGLSIGPHALQWGVVGFGFYVILNLFQSLRLSDPPLHAVLAGSPSLMLCIAAGSLQSAINYGVMGFTPSFLMKSYGLSPTETGLQFGLLSAGLGVIGPLVAGPVSDWFHRLLPGAGRVLIVIFALAVSPFLALWVYSAGNAGTFYLRFTFYSLVLTMWLPPLYAVMFDQVLPRMRAITGSIYIFVMTIVGLGIGPYAVGMVSDANGGDLAYAIKSINWVAPAIVLMLLVLLVRARRDEERLVERARAAGEPI
ncbi:Major Facilitator Superfamily protein [Novosphingobium sp. CF614]|uniref:MFS transporter n=1 Tax=Novosphingobium sp. CF614 TaxID=1884364 RepID=UPI0008DFB867|nr:MFS transporter [Novosphingobium sp. CF614]SFG44289.1 Major Facilitator Superfamily protein [Novosphingobium sp. CF614]